jgi:hypothetical protein
MSQNYDVEDQEMYSLGAAYDVEPIETKYRTFVVADFLAFLEDEDLSVSSQGDGHSNYSTWSMTESQSLRANARKNLH